MPSLMLCGCRYLEVSDVAIRITEHAITCTRHVLDEYYSNTINDVPRVEVVRKNNQRQTIRDVL